jgi:glutathione synthase
VRRGDFGTVPALRLRPLGGIVEAMSTKLVADGIWFVGIDVIGDKVVEINSDSPGGMQSVERLYEIDVCPTVIEALERRTCSKS